MKEINVIGTMQLLAACQKAPEPAPAGGEVHHRRLRLLAARPRAVHRGHGRQGAAAGRLRQGRRRGRGLRARVRPAPARRRVVVLRFANFIGPRHRHPADRLLHPARSSRPCSATTPACSSSTRTTRSRRCGWRTAGRPVGHLQRRRRRRAAAVRRPRAGRPAHRAGAGPRRGCRAVRPALRRWPTSRPSRCSYLAFGRGVDTTRMRQDLQLRARGTPPRQAFADFVEQAPAAPALDRERARSPRRRPAAPRGRRSRGRVPYQWARLNERPPTGLTRPGRRRPPRTPAQAAAGPTPRPAGGEPEGAGRPIADAGSRARRPRHAVVPPPRPSVRRSAKLRRRRPGLPAPADHRRLRGRRLRLRPRAHRPRAACRCCARSTSTWFRVEVRGIENIPAEGGALIVANHSGTLPLDALMTQLAVHDEHPAHRHLRMLGADLVFTTPVVGELARKTGTTLACNADAERLLGRGELVGVWPEGFKGIGKPFSERYKLQRFGRGGFVSAALRTGVPIVPCSIVGRRGDLPDHRQHQDAGPAARAAVPPDHADLPAGWARWALVPLPSKWIIEFGEPIPTDALRRGRRRRPDAGLRPHRPGARDDPAHAVRAADAAPLGLLLTASACWHGCSRRQCGAAPGRRSPGRRGAAGADAGQRRRGRPWPPCGRCGSPGSASRRACVRRAARRPG